MKNTQRAFTLIELMVALAILAILSMMAVPSFSNSIKNNRIESQLRSFGDHLKYARSEAASTQRTVTVCHLDAGTCDAAWDSGWTVFFDNDDDGVLALAGDVIKVHEALGGNDLAVVDSSGTVQSRISFNARGSSGTRMTAKFCDEKKEISYARAVILEPSGMAVRSRINSATGVYKDDQNVDLLCP